MIKDFRFMNETKKINGFTLFELLVTISIIAVLTAVAVVSFGGMTKKARDSRRIADLEKIRIALEAARQVGTTYPVSLTTLVTNGFLQQIPVDPKMGVGGTYVYVRLTDYTYRICTYVEESGSISTDISGCSGMPSGVGFTGYYKVINP